MEYFCIERGLPPKIEGSYCIHHARPLGMHDGHFGYIKKMTKNHQYVLHASAQDPMETR
jgi:hypothetical protein